jgi:hypothetical protein
MWHFRLIIQQYITKAMMQCGEADKAHSQTVSSHIDKVSDKVAPSVFREFHADQQ